MTDANEPAGAANARPDPADPDARRAREMFERLHRIQLDRVHHPKYGGSPDFQIATAERLEAFAAGLRAGEFTVRTPLEQLWRPVSGGARSFTVYYDRHDWGYEEDEPAARQRMREHHDEGSRNDGR